MTNLQVKELNQTAIEEQPIEICERKGLGHPDYICDAIMNEISVALSKEYIKRFGRVLHHNIDKGLLVAGETETAFSGGVLLKPMLLVIGDRATYRVGGDELPVNSLAVSTAKSWIAKNLRFVNPEEHIKFQVELKRGSQALMDIFERPGRFLGANDTSAAVGYAPISRTERIVLDVERFLNSSDFKRRFPEVGEDIKVMGLRNGNDLQLIIAIAFVDRFIDNEATYFRRKEETLEEVKSFIDSNGSFDKVEVTINAADRRGKGVEGLYLTVLGTSADGADCGQVGRGNRVNGVIPLNRPTGSEAAAGKNPVSHVGKIYNLLTFKLANSIYEEVSGIKETYVWLVSEIGRPINEPKMASVELILDKGVRLSDVSPKVRDTVLSAFDNLDAFCEELAYGKIPVC